MVDELKTLKDLKKCWPWTEFSKDDELSLVNYNDLKAEAVKWVKRLDKAQEMGATIPEQWKFIVFFNLTEEDLK